MIYTMNSGSLNNPFLPDLGPCLSSGWLGKTFFPISEWLFLCFCWGLLAVWDPKYMMFLEPRVSRRATDGNAFLPRVQVEHQKALQGLFRVSMPQISRYVACSLKSMPQKQTTLIYGCMYTCILQKN